ncbi:MAG: CARDB domain-containing protein [Gemmataceae bacterium]
MRRTFALAGLGVLAACLVGWATLASAQPLPGAGSLPPVPPPGEVGKPDDLPLPGGAVPPGAAPVPPPPAALPPVPPPSVPVPPPADPKPPVMPAKPDAKPVPPPGLPVPPVPLGDDKPAALTPPVAPPAPAAVPVPPPAAVPVPPPPSAEVPAAPATEPATPPSTRFSAKPPVGGEDRAAPVPESLIGRQEPSVSLEWVGSPVGKVGQPGDYSLVVRNVSNNPLQAVVVRVRVPGGLTVQGAEPKAQNDGGMLMWELGTLTAKQERILQMKFQADAKGDVAPQAWITFTGTSVMRIRVREPKLVVKCAAQEKVLVGDPAAFTLTVSNPGDGSADQVKIRAALTEGLEHARGNKIDFDIGSLAPGESRNVTLLCATRTGGAQKCEAVAEAEGGLTAKDAASLNVIMPRLDLQLAGPRLRYLERKAIYTLRVTNPGDAPATNVTVADVVPAGFKVLAASDGGRHDFQTRTVSWFLGEVGPGQSREVKVEVQAINLGDHKHKATAVGARGLRSESELLTKIEGLSALMVEMVDTEDPIEVGGDTAYEVRISNTGSKTENDIKLIAQVPDKMQFKVAQGPVRYREEGKTIVFEPIGNLAPRADVTFRIQVKALEPGTERFKIQVTSLNLTEPVIKMEATRIYADAPEAVGSPTRPTPAAAPVAPAPVAPSPDAPPAVPPVGIPPVSPVPPPGAPAIPPLPGPN